MIWSLFALSGALLDATYYAAIKKLLKDLNQYVLASGAFLSASFILLLISTIKGLPEIASGFYLAVGTTVIINLVAATLYFKALKITDLSLSIPMISFTPIFLIFTSFVLLREFPTLLGIAGIFLIVMGSYVLNLNKKRANLLTPFKEMLRNKGILYMILVAFLFSISSNFDKLVVTNSDPIFGSSIVSLLLGLSFLIISSIQTQGIREDYQKNLPKFLLVGGIFAAEAIAINIAFTMAIVPYVISLKRLSILFSVFYGGLLFREKNILFRIFGALIMVAGAALMILFKRRVDFIDIR